MRDYDTPQDTMKVSMINSGLTPEFMYLRADTLKSPEYQRPLRPGWAKKIAKELDMDKFWPLIISRRVDGDYVLDGQHRLHAVRDILNWRDENVPCEVYSGLTPEMEAKLYTTQASDGRKPITPLERLHADVVRGEQEAQGLMITVKRAGLAFDWTNGKGDGTLRAATQMRRLYKSIGPALLLETLSLLRDTWGLSSNVYQEGMVTGMAAFLVRYKDDPMYTRAEFVRKLEKFSFDEVLARSRQIALGLGSSNKGGGIATGRAMHVLYNLDRRSKRLPEWQEGVMTPEMTARRLVQLSDAGKARAAQQKQEKK